MAVCRAGIDMKAIDITQLRADLDAAGWRFGRNANYPQTNECTWYAWLPHRPMDWPDCECNHKPPALSLHPFLFTLNGRTHASAEFQMTGQMHNRWHTLKMYSVGLEEAMQAIPEALAYLGAAWKAIAQQEQLI